MSTSAICARSWACMRMSISRRCSALATASSIKGLQVEPEFRARAEEVSQAQGGVSGDAALPVQNAGDAVGRHIQLARQFCGAHAEFFQFFGQVFARIYPAH